MILKSILPEKKYNQVMGMVLSGICIFLTAVSVYLCFSEDIWYDELFTMGLAKQPLAGLLSIAAEDVHPPLYYLIVKLVLQAGELATGNLNAVVIAKMVSVIPFVLLMVYGMTLVRKAFGTLTAGLFCFLVYTMPQISQYAVELRMYGFSLFFVTAGMLHAYEMTRGSEKKSWIWNWAGMTLCLTAAAYSHYFAFVAATFVYLYLLIRLTGYQRFGRQQGGAVLGVALRKEWIGWGCSAGAAFFAYLPWLTKMIGQMGRVKESYWIQPLTWRSIGGCVKFLFQPSLGTALVNAVAGVILFALFLTVMVMFIFQNRKTARREVLFLLACLGILGGVVIFGFAASFLFRPIFLYRYMLPAAGVFWLAFAIALGKLAAKNKIFYGVLVLFFITGLCNFRAFYGEEMWKRVQMQSTEEALTAVQAEDILIFNFNHTQGVVSYYLPNRTYLYDSSPEGLIMEMFPEAQAMGGADQIRAWMAEGKRVWFLGSGNAREDLRREWMKQGIFAEEKASCLLERYWFNLYYLSGDS